MQGKMPPSTAHLLSALSTPSPNPSPLPTLFSSSFPPLPESHPLGALPSMPSKQSLSSPDWVLALCRRGLAPVLTEHPLGSGHWARTEGIRNNQRKP